MKKYHQKITCFALITVFCALALAQEAGRRDVLPQGFVYISDLIPDVLLDIRYYSTYNFVGARVDGYCAPTAVLSAEAAQALKKVSDELKAQGYLLKIFDAYRPQKAVQHFVRWAKDLQDTVYRQAFYPDIDKSKLFELGYIAERSGHSRGSVVDLTLVDIRSGQELDMGTPFDFFGPKSGHGTDLITEEQTANRELLKSAMLRHGFRHYREEWWHYTLVGEPFPNTYFDFDVAM
ncbi:MAG: M15 family metallopeptidase [Bacteroidales bacterium]|nr:M15 family metallopeptidase [Bacteroidales bacterium]